MVYGGGGGLVFWVASKTISKLFVLKIYTVCYCRPKVALQYISPNVIYCLHSEWDGVGTGRLAGYWPAHCL